MKRVLVVDDDEQIRRLIVRVLQQVGVEADQLDSGVSVAEYHRKHRYDLIITDIIMPDKEGIETILELRRDDPSLKIIAISGGGKISSSDCLLMARRLGAAYTFAKPFQCDELKNAVAKLLGENDSDS